MCVPDELKLSLTPLLETISHLNKQIYSLDKAIESTAQNRYPETNRLRQVSGVGPITALQYVLTIGDPGRFTHSRDIPAYLGLTPRRHQSGSIEQQLRISKAGNKQLRSLLVQCAQYLLDALALTATSNAGALECSNEAGKIARNEQSWPWLENLLFFSTVCGLPVTRTILFIMSPLLPSRLKLFRVCAVTGPRCLKDEVVNQEESKNGTVFMVTACFFPGLRGRQKDCSTNLMLRTPMCTRPR
jgi:hypothetical protein